MALTARFLIAAEGDCVLVAWPGRRMLVDLGTDKGGPALLDAVMADGPELDVLMVTHVDTDHIGGILSGIVDPSLPGLRIGDVWFNGWEHLQGKRVPIADVEHLGPKHGELFAKWLRGREWNSAFDRGPAELADSGPKRIRVHGLGVTVLGPTRGRLEALIPEWSKVVDHAAEGVTEEEPADEVERLGGWSNWKALEDFAGVKTSVDTKAANGSSIVLLLEHETTSMILTGDAYGADIELALRALAKRRPMVMDKEGRIPIDVMKAPHHGSRRNLPQALVDLVDARTWVFSSTGASHGHPDQQAVARVLCRPNRKRLMTLAFNVETEFNALWKNSALQRTFNYDTLYGTPNRVLQVP